MSFTALTDITRPDADLPAEGAISVLNLPERQDRDLWIPRLIHAKKPFAIASLDAISQEEVTRLAETSRRRTLPVAILNAYRLIPVFAMRWISACHFNGSFSTQVKMRFNSSSSKASTLSVMASVFARLGFFTLSIGLTGIASSM